MGVDAYRADLTPGRPGQNAEQPRPRLPGRPPISCPNLSPQRKNIANSHIFPLTATDGVFIHKNMFAAAHLPQLPEGTPDVLRRLAWAFAGLFESIGRAFNPQPNPIVPGLVINH